VILDREAHTGFLDVTGGSLEYRWIPPRGNDEVVLVLLHEGLGCVAMWKDFPDRLARDSGCGVFLYSRAGYGASSGITLPRATRYMHDEAQLVLPAVLERVGIESSILIGHSDGGSIGIIYGGSPPTAGLRGLVLLAAHVFNEAECVAAIRSARQAFEQASLRPALARYHGEQVDAAFRGWNDVWLSEEFWHWNIEAYLPRIEVPVFVVQGRDDEYGTLAQVDAIRAGLPAGSCKTLLISDCGHSPHRDAPERVSRAVCEFVRDVG